jgi:hypothetical protein
MAKKSYSEKLKHPKWQRKRLEVMQRDDFKCRLCRDDETMLHVHHLSYEGEPWEVCDDELITLCHHCHEQVELLKKDHEYIFFDDLDIIKIMYDDDSYLFFIRYCSNVIIRYLQSNKSGGYYIDLPHITELNKLKNKANRYLKKIRESKDIDLPF